MSSNTRTANSNSPVVADYSAYEAAPGSDLLQQLSNLAENQRQIENDIQSHTEKLEKLKKDLQDVSERKIPELMDKVEMKEFVTSKGLKICIEEHLRANIPKPRMGEAVKWLDDNGHEKLVKRKFVINFQKEDEAWANKFAADLRKRKKPVDCQEEKSIHHRTLSAFVKEQLEAGVDVPLDVFGVFRQRVSTVEVKS